MNNSHTRKGSTTENTKEINRRPPSKVRYVYDDASSSDSDDQYDDEEQRKDTLFYGHHIRAHLTKDKKSHHNLQAIKNDIRMPVHKLVCKMIMIPQIERDFHERGQVMLDEKVQSGQMSRKKADKFKQSAKKIAEKMNSVQRNGISQLLEKDVPKEIMNRDTKRKFSDADWQLYDQCLCRMILRCMKAMCDDGMAFKKERWTNRSQHQTATAIVDVSQLRNQVVSKCGLTASSLVIFVRQFPHFFTVTDANTIYTEYDFVKDELSVNTIPLLDNVNTVRKLLGQHERIVVNDLPILTIPTGEGYQIEVVHEAAKVDRWLSQHASSSVDVIALDCEWDFIKPYSDGGKISHTQANFPDTIQMATDTGCLIYRTQEGASTPSKIFLELLNSKTIAKIWCGMSEDVRLLNKWFAQHTMTAKFENFVDLQKTKSQLSLDLIVALHLNKRLTKDSKLQFSRWSREVLRQDQIVYAAEDVYAILQVFRKDGLDPITGNFLIET